MVPSAPAYRCDSDSNVSLTAVQEADGQIVRPVNRDLFQHHAGKLRDLIVQRSVLRHGEHHPCPVPLKRVTLDGLPLPTRKQLVPALDQAVPGNDHRLLQSCLSDIFR